MSEKEQILQSLNKNFKEPKLRFANYKEPYLCILLGEITEKNGKKAKGYELEYTAYSVNNITGFELQTSQWDGASYITTSKEGYKIVNFNEFAYNPARINIGSIGLFKDKIGIVSSLYVVFKITKDIIPEYLLKLMKTNKFNKQILARQEGGVRSYFFYENFSKVKIYIPSKLDEQRRIVDFLDLINLKIKLLEMKINTLKKYKKGLLQSYTKLANQSTKIFKISSVCELMSGYNFTPNDYCEDGIYEVITIGNVLDERYVEGPFKKVNIMPSESILLREDDLLISMTGNVGRTSFVKSMQDV